MGLRRVRRAMVAGAVALAALAIWMWVAGIAAAAGGSVDIKGFAFSPKTIHVPVGASITWTNDDAIGHTATADDGSFDTHRIGSSKSATVTFAAAGTFAYHCSIHPSMTGRVVVGSASTRPTTPDTSAAPAPGRGTSGPPGGTFVLIGAALVGGALARRRFGRA
jgi:plastocyanin